MKDFLISVGLVILSVTFSILFFYFLVQALIPVGHLIADNLCVLNPSLTWCAK